MVAFTGLLSMALLGGDLSRADGTPGPAPDVRVQIHVLEMKGLEWRSPVHEKLTPAGRQGTSTIWTARRDLIPGLIKAADKCVVAPTVRTRGASPVTVQVQEVRHHVADVRRVADGPPGKNACLAFQPDIDEVRDGFPHEISCRTETSGLVLHGAIRDLHLTAIQTVNVPGTVTDPKDGKTTTINATIQVPTVVSGSAEGDWRVGPDEAVIVSLGSFVTSDAKGRAVVRERLAIVEPLPAPRDEAASKASHRAAPAPMAWLKAPAAAAAVRPMPVMPPIVPLVASPTVGAAPHPRTEAPARATFRVKIGIGWNLPGDLAHLDETLTRDALTNLIAWATRPTEIAPGGGLKAATPPSRALPTPIAADGRVVDLPPLPDDRVETTSADEWELTLPAPQSRPVASPPRGVPQQAGALAGIAYPKRIQSHGASVVTGSPAPARDELVLFPAPVPAPDAAEECVDDPKESDADSATFRARTRGGVVRPDADATRTALQDDPSTRPRPFVQLPDERPEDVELPTQRSPRHLIKPAPPEGSTLKLQLNGAGDRCEYDSQIRLKSLSNEPVTIRVPMADGTIVEVQARVVKGARR